MRGLVGSIALLAARIAAADRVIVGQHTVGNVRAAVSLDAIGWAVDASLSFDEPDAHGIIEITDDRRTVRVEVVHRTVALDGQSYPFDGELSGVHALRVEQAGGRTILLVDGQVAIDRDNTLPVLVVDAPRGVRCESRGGTWVHWDKVVADTAPASLARSRHAYAAATHFAGPFAEWLVGWSMHAMPRRAELAALVLPERVRACVAFAMVAAISRKRPAHFRADELAPPRTGEARMPSRARDLEPFDGPAPPPPSDLDRVAQGELRRALQAKDPAEAYTRAISIVLHEAPFPDDATDDLLARLARLATKPDACR